MRFRMSLLFLAVMVTVGCNAPFRNNLQATGDCDTSVNGQSRHKLLGRRNLQDAGDCDTPASGQRRGGRLARHRLPPAERLMHPGPGVDGPGPGVIGMYQPNVPMPQQVSQVNFVGPDGMMINWDVSMPGMFDSEALICPGRYNFPQGANYRLKLTNIPGRPGVELYPSLEVGPTMPRTQAFLAHNAIPAAFTEEDFDQVLSGNFVTKVIYLPDAEYQELALAGVETLVSTRLDPGVDPVVEADKRGAILGIIRMGNKDMEMPGGAGEGAGVVPAFYAGINPQTGMPMPGAMGMPMPGAMGMPPMTSPSNYIAGITGPQYGMPISGTPIGLTGPPHIPHGVPAGLQKHTITNHTRMRMPQPTTKMRIDVTQRPGYSYPRPSNHARIVERTTSERSPLRNRRTTGDSCEQGACVE